MTVDQLEDAAADRTEVLLFVSPSNPTGAAYRRDRVAEIGRLAFARLVGSHRRDLRAPRYGGRVHHSMPVVVPQLADRCVVVNGVAKTYAMTGWLGWLIGPADVAEAATNLQSHATSNVNNVARRARSRALLGELTAVGEMREACDRRPGPSSRCCPRSKGFRAWSPKEPSTRSRRSRASLGVSSGVQGPGQLSSWPSSCWRSHRVAFVPGEAFGAPGYGRFSYALSDSDLARGIERLAELLSEVGG